MGEGDKAEFEAEERVPRAKTAAAAEQIVMQRQMEFTRARSRLQNRARPRSISAPPTDNFKRPCWSVHFRNHWTERDDFIEMVVEMMTKHGRATNLPTTLDLRWREFYSDATHLGQGLAEAAHSAMMWRGPNDQRAHRIKELPAWRLLPRRKD